MCNELGIISRARNWWRSESQWPPKAPSGTLNSAKSRVLVPGLTTKKKTKEKSKTKEILRVYKVSTKAGTPTTCIVYIMCVCVCSAVIKCAFIHTLHYAWISIFIVCCSLCMTSGYRNRAIDNKLQYRACTAHVYRNNHGSRAAAFMSVVLGSCTQVSCCVRYRNRRWQANTGLALQEKRVIICD